MNRRTFLHGALGSAMVASLGARGSCRVPEVPGSLDDVCIVDAHCHIFNANDIPIEGFLKNSILKELQYPLAPLVEAVDWHLQETAPSFEEENAFLDSLLAGEGVPKELDKPVDARASYGEFLRYLKKERPGVYAEVLKASDPASKDVVVDLLFQVFQFVLLLRSMRYTITERLLEVYGEAKLFIPVMLDFGPWLEDDAETSISEQIVLYEKLVRLFQGRIHPMVGYDPLRDVTDFGGAPGLALEQVKLAVQEMGFVGVKLYPVMGFRPSANDQLAPFSHLHQELDEAMDRLFAWAEAEDVPITFHSSSGNTAQRGNEERIEPVHWESVLEKYPRLRVNFAHFGGDQHFAMEGRESRAWEIADLMTRYENVYADASFFDIGLQGPMFGFGDFFVDETFAVLEDMFETFPVVQSRLMYGSDWHEIYTAPGANEYLRTFHERFGDRFPELKSDVMGANALRWLGLDGAASGNRERLIAYYDRHGLSLPDWWIDAG